MPAELVAAADGSSLANPGPAGWAWYIDEERWAAGGWHHGTNNMGELAAVLHLLESTAGDSRPLKVLCDSQYVINSLTKWLPGWKRRGWRKGDGKPVLNVELMKALDEQLAGRDVRFEWVKGHAGHRLNEEADTRARAAAEAYRDGKEPECGPGFGVQSDMTRFAVGQREEEPDLFSVAEEPEPEPVTSGSASPRVKATLITRTKELLRDEVRTDPARLEQFLHPDFVSHAIDGSVVDLTRGAWLPLDDRDFEVLSVDSYSDDVVGMRWSQRDRLRFSLWQQTPVGWRLRFAQVTRKE